MKFKLTDETILHNGIILHRIECIKAFGDVEIGDKGGWVESMDNLSQEGNAWIYGDAKVYGKALVRDNAEVYGNTEVYENAFINGKASVFGNAKVCGTASVWGSAHIYGKAEVYGNAKVYGNAEVCGNAKVYGFSMVDGNALVYGSAQVCDDAKIYGDALVCDAGRVEGHANICGDAKITSTVDYMVFKNTWSSGRYFTWTRSNNMWRVGRFYGTGEQLIKKAYRDSTKKGDCYKATVEYVENIHKLIENESK